MRQVADLAAVNRESRSQACYWFCLASSQRISALVKARRNYLYFCQPKRAGLRPFLLIENEDEPQLIQGPLSPQTEQLSSHNLFRLRMTALVVSGVRSAPRFCESHAGDLDDEVGHLGLCPHDESSK